QVSISDGLALPSTSHVLRHHRVSPSCLDRVTRRALSLGKGSRKARIGLSASAARAYCPLGSQLYSMPSATAWAHPVPRILLTRYNAPSIPDDRPAVVMTFPLSTYRRSLTTFVLGYVSFNTPIAPATVVAD